MNIKIDSALAVDISIPLRFNEPQPNAYGVAPAVSSPVEAGDVIGDTRKGGSVNFERYTFIPHCSGTHTECLGHITHERISVRDCLQDVIVPAVLISAEPERLDDGDMVITRSILEGSFWPPREALTDVRATDTSLSLIVRTLPNDESKLTREYGETNTPPYFTTEAMEYIVECGFKHLLVDMPSIDRLFDDGKLSNHRIFWSVEQGSFEVNENSRVNSTITELIYVPNKVEGGEYLLNLQIAPFESDCAPSRPILLKKN